MKWLKASEIATVGAKQVMTEMGLVTVMTMFTEMTMAQFSKWLCFEKCYGPYIGYGS